MAVMNLKFIKSAKRNLKLLPVIPLLLAVTVNASLFVRSTANKFAKNKAVQTTPVKNFPNIKIRNFGKMDEKFYRGAQPQKDDYQSLKLLGVKTVIDLRDDPTDYEKAAVESLGMRYVNIPMSDKKYPQAESIVEFLKLADDPKTGVFFVHCEGGRHRTGVVGAVYRLTKYGWSYDQAYQEMKSYDFYTRWGHAAMKDFVVDYAAQLKARRP